MKAYSKMEKIMMQFGIRLTKEDGSLRNVVDVIEDLYLKTNSMEIQRMLYDFSEEEKESNIFDDARGGNYEQPINS